MHKSQANRAVIAARVQVSRNQGTVGMNPAARVDSTIPIIHVHNRKSPKMTAAQRDSTGKRSAWNASPHFWTDPAWAYTLSNKPDGPR